MKTSTLAGVVLVDLDRCTACKSCELACAKVHAGFDDVVEALLADAHLVSRVNVVAAGGRNVPVHCQHCEDAPCAAVCTTGAIYRDAATGRVVTDPAKCIQCRACVRVCPFGAVIWDKEAKCIIKCDVCEGLVDDGEGPRCVVECPTGALSVVAVEDLHRRSAELVSLVRDEGRIGLAGPSVAFRIEADQCICCGRCARNCPVDCISGKRGKPPGKATEEDKQQGKAGEPFRIDQERCIRCGTCLEVCPRDAVKRFSEEQPAATS